MAKSAKPTTPGKTTTSHNNTLMIVGIVMLLIAVLGTALFFATQQKKANSMMSNEQNSMMGAPNSNGGNNIFSGVKDIFSKQLSLQCDFTDPESGKTTLYIKNGAMASNNTQGNMIMKDKKIYVWEAGKTEGFIMEYDPKQYVDNSNTAQVSPMPESNSNEKVDAGSMLKDVEKFKDSCKPAVVSDSIFNPPANIKFMSMQQMMNQEMQKQGISQEDMKKMQNGTYVPPETTQPQDYNPPADDSNQ